MVVRVVGEVAIAGSGTPVLEGYCNEDELTPLTVVCNWTKFTAESRLSGGRNLISVNLEFSLPLLFEWCLSSGEVYGEPVGEGVGMEADPQCSQESTWASSNKVAWS